MSTRLGPDSSIHQVLSWIAALVLANLACVVVSVPILTAGIGVLVTSLVALRLIESESTAILPAVSLAIRGAWLPASLLFLAESALGLLLAWEWVLASNLANPTAQLLARALVVFVALALVIVHVWVWPMMAYRLLEKGRVGLSDLPVLVRAAFLVGVAKAPRALAALLVALGPFALASLSLPWAIRVAFWFLVFGIAFASYVAVLAVHPVLSSALDDGEASVGLEGEARPEGA